MATSSQGRLASASMSALNSLHQFPPVLHYPTHPHRREVTERKKGGKGRESGRGKKMVRWTDQRNKGIKRWLQVKRCLCSFQSERRDFSVGWKSSPFHSHRNQTSACVLLTPRAPLGLTGAQTLGWLRQLGHTLNLGVIRVICPCSGWPIIVVIYFSCQSPERKAPSCPSASFSASLQDTHLT